MASWTLAVIGGSGLYDMPGLDGAWEHVATPWGDPVELYRATLSGVPVLFLPRHGRGHKHSPTSINYRAAIDALKRAGATDILSLSAVGSLKEAYAPGAFVIVDQYVDRTFAREKSYFGAGCVAHVSMADPVCARLSNIAVGAARKAGAPVFEGGTYLCMEGPQFSTRAESHLYRSWGCDVIGMTNMPEAKLAREAELPYASVAMVTDYDCWHEEAADVEVTHILDVLHANAGKARAALAYFAEALAATARTPSPIDTCLDHALITAPDARDPALLAKLDVVAGRVLGVR
ncbi:MAG: S-methyl-5'-thioadenosine phosphorylase [Caulobacterales bacterium]